MAEGEALILPFAAFVAFVAILLVRRKMDPIAAYVAVWALAVGGWLTGLIHYYPLPAAAIGILLASTWALLIGYWTGGRLAAELPVVDGLGSRFWEALTDHRYLLIALLLLGKSFLLLMLQAQAGAFSDGAEGPAVVRGTARSSLAVYIGYLSLGDFILAPIGGMRVQRCRQYVQGLIPVFSLFVISLTLGGRTYVFWGAVATLAGYLYSQRATDTVQVLKRLAVLSLLTLLLAGVVESIRFLRSGGLPYATSLTNLLPFSELIGEDVTLLDSLVTVAIFYWTSALAAFGHYVTDLGQVDVNPFGWAIRGIINVYDIHQLREAAYVPVRTNVYTWLPYFYEDLGWLGFLAYPFVLGGLAGYAFRRFQIDWSAKYLVVSSLLTAVLVFSPFDFALGNKALYLALLLSVIL